MTVVRTDDGGARQPEADLWCSYAAVRALRWLGGKTTDPDSVADFLLSRRNDDGGFGWQRGLPSDVWATYYCAQGLADLGAPALPTDRLSTWLASTRCPDGGFGMTPGQAADVWATYYASRLSNEILGEPVGNVENWLAALQTKDGGLTWAPGMAVADVRAGYYGAVAWATSGSGDPWDRGRLVGWLQDQQGPDGGFRFAPDAQACTWAAFRATGALRALGARPRDTAGLADWLSARALPSGGFERWEGYGQADVWSAFTVTGALSHVDLAPPAAVVDGAIAMVQDCQLPGTGFTYRNPAAAGDSLATAAYVLTQDPAPAARDWLLGAQAPYEGGVMYMPGRGAEVRCTLWAASALQRIGASLDTERLGVWLRGLQNPDGGLGYWLGRGSDLTSTTSAVEIAVVSGLDPAAVLDTAKLADFVNRCTAGEAEATIPGGPPSLAATAQAARARQAIGVHQDVPTVANALDVHASRLGGYSAQPRHLPDLVSTYQAVLTSQILGLPWNRVSARRLLDRISDGDGYAWSPLSRRSAGPLADCLGHLLARAIDTDDPLPRLNL